MRHKKVITGIFVLWLPLLWFGAVDWSWFVEFCPDCGYGRDVGQYRVFTIPIQEVTHEFPSVTERVARDLGVVCQHSNNERWHKHRWWGLCFCKAPCINGMYQMTGDDSWYTADVSQKLSALVETDPAIQAEFSDRVLKKHDFNFVQTVLARADVER